MEKSKIFYIFSFSYSDRVAIEALLYVITNPSPSFTTLIERSSKLLAKDSGTNFVLNVFQTKNICCSNFEYQKHNACVIDGRTFSPGTYRGRVQPLSLAAPGALSEDEFKITIQAPPTKNVVLQGVLSSLSAVLVLVIIVGCIVAKK